MRERHNLMAYYRKGEKTLLVIGNYQKKEQDVTLPAPCKKVLLNNYPEVSMEGRTIRMQGYQALILEM